MAEIKKVGFIGVGRMGNPMAGHLVRAGYDVTIFDIRPEALQAFVAQHGGKAASSLAEVGQCADAVITMLPDDRVVRKVILGDGQGDRVAAGLAQGSVAIDMSTSDPTGTVSLGRELAVLGVGLIDAPVMGGVIFAKDATLDIMVGGEAELIERCRPLFDTMGRQVFRCGGLGSAHALKALNNYVNACALINVIEALTIGRKFGLDTKVMVDSMISMCAGRNHPIEKKVIPHVLTRKYDTGMTMGFIAKDVRIAIDMAKAIGAPAPLGERCAELWAEAAERLGPALDQTEIVRYWEEAAGVGLNADQ
jgi:3-hydroxyisobutyrate dehydrogenase